MRDNAANTARLGNLWLVFDRSLIRAFKVERHFENAFTRVSEQSLPRYGEN
jgi:hypothetical protein